MMKSAVVIDSLEFARSGEELSGEVSVAELTRLADALFDTDGHLRYRVRGGYDRHERPRLTLTVDGEINLTCQRCLDSLLYPIAVKSSLLLLTPDKSAQTGGIDDLDGVPADAHTDVCALVEDEVLLAVPFAARHPEGQCAAAVKTANGRAASPFAVLASLKDR